LAVVASVVDNQVKAYKLESTRVHPSKMPTLILDSGIEKMASIAKQFVRIKPAGTRPGDNAEKCGYPPENGDPVWTFSKKPEPFFDAYDEARDGEAHWPKEAHWALRGNRIQNAHPDRGVNYVGGLGANGHRDAPSSGEEDFEVESVIRAPRVLGDILEIWWILVKVGPVKYWIDETNFQYVYQPAIVKDRRRLSEVMQPYPQRRRLRNGRL